MTFKNKIDFLPFVFKLIQRIRILISTRSKFSHPAMRKTGKQTVAKDTIDVTNRSIGVEKMARKISCCWSSPELGEQENVTLMNNKQRC